MLNTKGPWLGQIPLRAAPSFLRGPGPGTPPYYGQWGVYAGGGVIGDSGQVGPFDTTDEAFNAAVKDARKAGAGALPADGFAKVIDSKGQPIGPVT